MSTPQYVDISAWQPPQIDWALYKAWSSVGDGISRVAMRSSYGYGYTDQHYTAYRAGAVEAGIDCIIYYHYAYPQYNSAAMEAQWQHQIIGTIRPQDKVMLDLEEKTGDVSSWAYDWLTRMEAMYGTLPLLYASDSYIRTYLQDVRLGRYPLVLANWTFNPNERPPCPPPWSYYTYLQYSDRAVVPGMPGPVDADIYLGGAEWLMSIQAAAFDTWHSTKGLLLDGTQGPCRYDSGIARAWLIKYLAGTNMPPPVTNEIHSVDWNGNPIVVQFFLGTPFRCEWRNGQAYWYG